MTETSQPPEVRRPTCDSPVARLQRATAKPRAALESTRIADPLAAEAHAEAVDDLERLQRAADQAVRQHAHADAGVRLAAGLLSESRWGRIELASVLGVALARINELETTS